ncbi:MAG: hypothetical protein ACI8XM_000900 [Haloarculaceae archaeon]|jgi:hypothetical protein
MGYVTDVAPAGLVPAAWLVTLGAHTTSLVTARTIFIAMVVMDVLLVAFFVASLGEMTGVLATWQRVIVLGLVATLVGTADMALDPGANPLLPVTLYAWMLLPGLAYVPTGTAHADATRRRTYLAAAALSVAGAGVYAFGHLGGISPATTTVVGLTLVGIGQTAGIVAAVLQNTGQSAGTASPA